MKRLFCCVLSLLLIIGMLPYHANAAGNNIETIYFQDGSYLVTEIITNGSRASGNVTGSKPSAYYDSEGVIQWRVTLTGSFTYNGSSATCTSSSANVTIYDSTWYTISKTTGKSGNTATASVTMGKKAVGVTVAKVPISMTLECDADGNLS